MNRLREKFKSVVFPKKIHFGHNKNFPYESKTANFTHFSMPRVSEKSHEQI